MLNNVYTKGYHLSHEEAIRLNNLIPEKVLEQNIIKCPSWMCETKDFNSPEQLVSHLQVLGIKPFWYVRLVLNKKNDNINIIKNSTNKIYNSDTCLMCLENNSVNIIINKCGHQVYCMECVRKLITNCHKNEQSLIKSNCPICRCKIDYFYPYA